MKLFEITNGAIGESYVRCYAWAMTSEEALAMALPAFQAKYTTKYNRDERGWSDLKAEELFDDKTGPFVTTPNDAGWWIDK